MKTIPMYLEDSYAKDMTAAVLEVFPEGDPSTHSTSSGQAGSGQGKRWRIILDKTVFYPMGGGQPTDQGTLTGSGWSGNVYQVLMKDGEIGHFVESEGPPEVGMSVQGVIDWDRRYKNMKVHSAGHVIDFAMHILGFSPSVLSPQKGDHGKKPCIVYAGTVDHDITKELEDKSNELVTDARSFVTAFVPLEELQKDAIYLQPGLPTNKPLRKLTLDGVGSVADGGTQVKNTSEVGQITILAVNTADGNTTVEYKVS